MCKTSSKNQETSIYRHIYIIKTMTNLNYQKDEGNGTSCSPQPPMFHPQLDDFSITPLRKPLLFPKLFILPIKKLNPNFLIREVILRKNGHGITDTLFHHRNMENRMNHSQFTRKFQLISNLTNPLQDFVRTTIRGVNFLLLPNIITLFIGEIF